MAENQITAEIDDEQCSDNAESPLREFPSVPSGRIEFGLGSEYENADIVNGNVPADSENINRKFCKEEKNSALDEVNYASTIVTGIFRDMGLLEKEGPPEGSNDADLCNGNIPCTNNHSQGLDNTALSKVDGCAENNEVNIEVTHFELSKFPSVN